ncbi:hypothetical protein BLOT_004159, partial [Blomia tropicalis]
MNLHLLITQVWMPPEQVIAEIRMVHSTQQTGHKIVGRGVWQLVIGPSHVRFVFVYSHYRVITLQ